LQITITKNEKTYTITDNSHECNSATYFLKTFQNEKYLEDAKSKNPIKIITAKECLDLLDIANIKIVGITGTNGKTTTAAAIYSILLDLGKKVGMQGTRGCFINEQRVADKSLTTPPILQTIQNLYMALNESCEYFIMEVSSHAIEQKRIEGLNFALKILTNISQDHLDYHKSLDNYVAVKSSFFSDETPKLINKDESKIRFNKVNCMTYGLEQPATYKIAAYSLKEGIAAAVQNIDKVFDFSSPMHGLFNVYNTLAAISAVDMLKVAPIQEICEAMENFGGVEGRMQVVSEKPLVIVDFAHTPDGMEKVLDSLKDKDIIVVFGAGGDRDKTKRPLMARVANRFAKKVIITSDNPRSENPDAIIEDILSGLRSTQAVLVEANREKAIKMALDMRENDEIVLILGKGDETYQEIKGKKIPFDDREIVKKHLS
jgi:UDP-N-acetylmuramoyl-L-alanyl-D-glutamate--2,6-diaminopimelate ligase